MVKQSRRRFLATATAAGTAASGVTGCLNYGPFGGFDADYGPWLPRPDALPYTDRYAIRSFSPDAIASASVLQPSVERRLSGYTDAARALVGVPSDAVDSLLKLGYFTTVLTGGFDPERIGSTLTQAGWSSLAARYDFDRYRSADGATALAVADSAVVVAPGVRRAEQPFLDPVLRAKAGEIDRYLGSDATLQSLAEALGNGDVVVARDDTTDPPIDGVRATGIAWRFTENVANTTVGFAFESDGAVDLDAVEALTNGEAFSAYEKINVGQRGRVGIVTAEVPTVTAAAMAPVPSISDALGTVPNASFDFTIEGGDGGRRLHITHDGGEPVARSRLFVRGEGFAALPRADQTAPGRWQGETSHQGTVVAGGDRVVVGVESGAAIEVVYEPIAESTPVTMASFEG